MVSIGGWTGSRFFSTAVGSEANRTAFVKAVVDLAQKFELGGVDFEYVAFRNLVLSQSKLLH